MKCLYCAHPFEIITPTVHPTRKHRPGSIILCERCLEMHVVAGDGRLRKPRDTEVQHYEVAYRRAVKAITGIEL